MLGYKKWMGLTCGLALMLAAAQPASAAWTVTTFDRAGATDTQLWGINDTGQFVGTDSLGGFIVSGNVTTQLSGPIGSVQVVPFAISNSGLVVGSWLGNDDIQHGFLLQGGVYTDFDINLPNVVSTAIRHVSLDGRWLTGVYIDNTGQQNGFVFDRTDSALQTVGQPGAVTFMQGSTSAGLSVGNQAPGGGLVFDPVTGQLQVVKTVAGFSGSPRFRDINDAGLITGFVAQQAIVGTLAGGFKALPISGASSSFGEGLNSVGQVVGSFNDANGVSHGFIASSVPEPAMAALWLAGLGLLAGARLNRIRRCNRESST